jgi:CheY-like chemotaxis protein
MNRIGRKIEILAVEDNPADVIMISELFKYSSLNPNVRFVNDGAKALDYIFKRGEFVDAIRPDIILLDLNLPKKDGREVLKELKGSKDFCCIPVLVLSTSSGSEDVHRCYELHANCYFTKPGDLEEFNTTMRAIEDCWMKLVNLPDYPNLNPGHKQAI